MRILHVASEVAPWAHTGGLGDVLGALPAAQARVPGVTSVHVLAPLYRAARGRLGALAPVAAGTVELGPHRLEVAVLRAATAPHVAWLDAPALYDRDGLYGPGGRGEFADNHIRFAALCRAAIQFGAAIAGGPVDLVHGHDWQGGLAAYAARGAGVASALTIHNLAFRGLAPKSAVDDLGLPWRDFTPTGFEFYDQLSMLKAGLTAADVVTTVSPRYASEIRYPPADEGLGGCLRHDVRRLVGILNGIDVDAWDPARDPALPARFSIDDLAGKAACRAAIRHELGLPDAPVPLAAIVSRLSWQKGLDVVCDLAPRFAAMGLQLVVLGHGDEALERRLVELALAFPATIAVRIGFDLALSRRVYGGADLFLMPSRFEPCGLGQLYAMRYGAVPVVRAVGGLRDTVRDSFPRSADDDTGFRFEHADEAGLAWALGRALAEYRDAPVTFARRRRAAMERDSSWGPAAAQTVAEYQRAVEQRVRHSGPLVDAASAAPDAPGPSAGRE